MADIEFGYQEEPKNGNGIVRARTTHQIRSWEIPRTTKALEILRDEMGRTDFPGIYLLFDKNKVYIGEAKDIYTRLKTHNTNPETKIKNWDKAIVISDGRSATQSDFNDNVVRYELESYLIRLLKANKFMVLSQGQKVSLNPIQKHIANSLMQELNHFLLKKNVINKILEDGGQEEIFPDELKRLLSSKGKTVQSWSAYEATVDGEKTYIRPGSPKTKGWQITFRDRFLSSLEKGKGYLLVSRDGVLLIPLKEIQKAIKEPDAYKQNTIDVYISFGEDKTELKYKSNKINVTAFKLRK
ncbi:MAG: GIY-YIG nuclease family protein [Sedimentisphaerales bacterium]|nr:GIY-YIG nuclease family protein [Sedimentisphaerales bacterium]